MLRRPPAFDLIVVVFFAAHKHVKFKDTGISNENEKSIWKELRLYRPGKNPPANEEESKEVWIDFKKGINKVVSQFVVFWFFLWFTWFFLYFLFIIRIFYQELPYAFINFAFNANTLISLFLFMTLTVSTLKYGYIYWLKFFVAIVLILLLELYLNSVNENSKYLFSLITGIFGGVCFAAFISSINSKFLNIPIVLIFVMYFYVIIQPLYVFFNISLNHIKGDSSEQVLELIEVFKLIEIWVIVLAFFLKTLLLLVISWLLQTGRLTFFMVQESSLNFKNKELFKEFINNINLESSLIDIQNE